MLTLKESECVLTFFLTAGTFPLCSMYMYRFLPLSVSYLYVNKDITIMYAISNTFSCSGPWANSISTKSNSPFMCCQFDYESPPLSRQVQMLVRIMLNTLDAQNHQCKSIPEPFLSPVPSRSRGERKEQLFSFAEGYGQDRALRWEKEFKEIPSDALLESFSAIVFAHPQISAALFCTGYRKKQT